MSDSEEPKLKCRMYESRYPVEGSIVMGKVIKIEGSEAVVWLVEYRKRSKLILSAVLPPVRVVTLHRMEAFRVLTVNTEDGEVFLDENPLPLTDIWEFESRFKEAEFVHSVIYSVADDMKMDLKKALKLAGWPCLEKLKALHEDEEFLACKDVEFRKQLIKRIALMKYRSWRVRDPGLLQNCSLIQQRDICYTIALTRQAEAFFKQNGELEKDTYLSIQDVLNKAVNARLVFKDWTMGDIEPLVKILHDKGFILESQCPLTYSRVRTTDSDVHQFKVPQMIVLTSGHNVDSEFMHHKILDALENAPVACSVYMFPSYKSLEKDKDEIIEPTVEEKELLDEAHAYKLNLHTMLLTGDGVDRWGTHYYEFQDSYGDVRNGDRGFVKYAVHPNTVHECVVFKDYYDHGTDFD